MKPTIKPTRGMRNCNPLNIRNSKDYKWSGQIGSDNDGFCRFKSMLYGLRAAFCLLRTYNLKYKCRTIRQIIERWAPPTENHTELYILHVCQMSKMSDDTLCMYSGTEALSLFSAMARIESRYEPTKEELMQAQQMAVFG